VKGPKSSEGTAPGAETPEAAAETATAAAEKPKRARKAKAEKGAE
jgi:hypothetical protein